MRSAVQWFVPICLIGLCVFLVYGGAYSFTRPPALIVFGPGGRPVIVTFGHGNLFMLASGRPLHIVSSGHVYWTDESIDETRRCRRRRCPRRADNHASRFHFSFARKRADPTFDSERFVAAGVPLWFVLPPVVWFAWRTTATLLRRGRRRRLGLCPACGYDLRGITTRCPECGMPVKMPATN